MISEDSLNILHQTRKDADNTLVFKVHRNVEITMLRMSMSNKRCRLSECKSQEEPTSKTPSQEHVLLYKCLELKI